MRRSVFILLLGVLLAAIGYCGLYYLNRASDRNLAPGQFPELAWLKKEFGLSDAELTRITQLHEAYRPHCVEMCRRIDAKNAELHDLLATADSLTPEIETRLAEAAQLRLECQKAMIKHFLEVSRTMPPAQGRRYLAWVQSRTFLPDYGMGNK